MKKILKHLYNGFTLSKEEAKTTLKEIGEGKHNDVLTTAFIVVFTIRRITPDELSGFREAMLELCLKIDFSSYNTIDLCGTGGDGKDTFNVSTLTSFVVAGSGVKVAKHGNYGVSSSCGSSNLLEELGVVFTNNFEKLEESLDNANLCFLHAPLFHPAMKHIAPIRSILGIKTFFNILGPLVNPSSPKNQVVGVYSNELVDLYHNVLYHTDINYRVVHSCDIYDEISLTDNFRTRSKESDIIYKPQDFGFNKVLPSQIVNGKTDAAASKLFVNILRGGGSEAQNSVVLANSALAIQTANNIDNILECVEIAKDSLMSGAALRILNLVSSKNF